MCAGVYRGSVHGGVGIGGRASTCPVPVALWVGAGSVPVALVETWQEGREMKCLLRSKGTTAFDYGCVIFLCSVGAIWSMGGGIGLEVMAGGAFAAVIGGCLLKLQDAYRQ